MKETKWKINLKIYSLNNDNLAVLKKWKCDYSSEATENMYTQKLKLRWSQPRKAEAGLIRRVPCNSELTY
jgi:hypothetical protein